MAPWNKVAQGLPIKDRKVVFCPRGGAECVGRYDGLVFRNRDNSWFWHPSEISKWRYLYE